MSTQGAQLLAEGPQDVWLSGDPQVSFFRSMYRQHIPFGIELKKMNFDADGSYRFPRYGDMLGPCYITATDPVTNALVPLTSWYGLFDGVALTIGHQIVDFQDVTFSSQVWPTLEASSFSQRVVPAAGVYPLHFFFCKEWSRAFPLVALEYHDLVIKLVNAVSTYKFTLYGYIIHLDEHERAWVKNTPHKFLITQTQRTMITRDQKEFMRFSGPIKYLAFPTFEYTRTYSRLIYQTPSVIDTTTTQTYSVTYYNPEGYTIAWVVPSLPSGVTQAGQTTTGLTPTLTLSVAAGTLVTIQNIGISVIRSNPVPNSFWCARAGSSGIDFGYGITVDSSGSVYCTGVYTGTMTFYNGNGTAFGTTLPQIGGNDVFIVKYF